MDPIVLETTAILHQLIEYLKPLNTFEFKKKLSVLGHYSIGAHTRHIIELFLELEKGYDYGIINYDDRERSQTLENNPLEAIRSINNVIEKLDKPDKKLLIKTLYNNHRSLIKSSYHRELMYNLEHCVHHQAIIKIGFSSLRDPHHLDAEFGVAKSTLQYRD